MPAAISDECCDDMACHVRSSRCRHPGWEMSAGSCGRARGITAAPGIREAERSACTTSLSAERSTFGPSGAAGGGLLAGDRIPRSTLHEALLEPLVQHALFVAIRFAQR